MENNGWIKLHRKLLEWEWVDDPNTAWLFMICLMSANHEESKWHGILIKKGTFITSIEHLGKKAGLTPQQTRTSLNKLKSTSEITSESNYQYTVITIQNWEVYQTDNKRDNKRITSDQQTNNKRITTNNNDKNEKTSKNSLTPCTQEELQQISSDLNMPIARVIMKHDTIMDKIASGDFKYKTVYLTLRNWLRMDKEKLIPVIEKTPEELEEERILNAPYPPGALAFKMGKQN